MQPQCENNVLHQPRVLEQLELGIVILLIVAKVDIDRFFLGLRRSARLNYQSRMSLKHRGLASRIKCGGGGDDDSDSQNYRQSFIDNIDVLLDRTLAVEHIVIHRRIACPKIQWSRLNIVSCRERREALIVFHTTQVNPIYPARQKCRANLFYTTFRRIFHQYNSF